MILNNMKWEKWLFTVVHQIKQLSWMPPILQTAYMWICYYSNQEWYCFPSQKLLAENCWVSINAIRKYLAELEKIWLIKRERRYKDNMELSSIYQLVIGISTGGGGVYQQVVEGIAPDGDGTISTELNPKELDVCDLENTEDKEIQNTKYNKDEWDNYLSNEWFWTLIAKSLMEIWWKPKENTASFQKWVDKTLDANKITRSEKDYDKLKSGLIWFVEHFKVNKSKVPKASLSSNFCLRFNLK